MNLGKCIMILLEEVIGLKEASAFKGEEVVDGPLTVVQNLAMLSITDNKESIESIVKNLLNLNDSDEELEQFVVWVTVSKDWTVRKLQNDVANLLQMNINDIESDGSVAGRLNLKLRTIPANQGGLGRSRNTQPKQRKRKQGSVDLSIGRGS